jgi:hypothetical protein
LTRRGKIQEHVSLIPGMALLRKFWALGLEERYLLLRAFVLVASLRCALSLSSFVKLKNYLARRAARHSIPQSMTVAQLVWAVRTAAAYIPRATCLTQVLAAKYQLERSGRRGLIHIGVAKDNGQFLAHAWLECEGKIVIGGGSDGYTRLITVD